MVNKVLVAWTDQPRRQLNAGAFKPLAEGVPAYAVFVRYLSPRLRFSHAADCFVYVAKIGLGLVNTNYTFKAFSSGLWGGDDTKRTVAIGNSPFDGGEG